jgi:transcriptional regulator
MYLPDMFRERRLPVLHAMLRAHRLATLVTAGAQGLIANLIPFTLIEAGPLGTLRAHLARANEQLDELRTGTPALVIFQGPATYVTPSWYASKAEHGKVVPTWNYVVVQARGVPRVIEDHAWLRAQIDLLTAGQESQRATPWHVADAPEAFVAGQMRGIVGLEIPITQLDGKWKVSQNRSAADRQGVHDGLLHEGGSADMAQLVINRGA